MKKTLLLCLLVGFGLGAGAQTTSLKQKLEHERAFLATTDFVYPYIDTPPMYPGGDDKWASYVNSNTLLATAGEEAAREGLATGIYQVIVRFAVNKDGSVSDIKTTGKPIGYGLEDAAMSLVKNSGKWTPAHIEGENTRSWMNLAIRFRVTKD
ncbi:energy transducer TonB [Flaviaesturariibacter amylovorans]|uniref:TonB C-terminal domain-containing protein n=1 Tax=Flaviaesturariibacter amylovorans TaxID=1084520 RepID=A0ABP8HBX6_9BACT